MKIKFFLSIFTIFLFTAGCHQSGKTDPGLNLDFEIIEDGKPGDWHLNPQPYYSVYLDSKNTQSGKYSIVIESTGDSGHYQVIDLGLPHNYDGKNITLSGYMKTENVTDSAVLCITTFPEITSDFICITGTTNWEKYEVTLDMNPASTQKIVIGGLLFGKGKVWFDDFQVTIDSVDIKNAKVYEKKPLPAESDKVYHFSSNIAIPLSKNPDSKEDKTLIANLELLGKLWGFLKYHHPEIGKGNYNWDNELFRFLPGYLKVDGTSRRNEILLQWIEKYGNIPECKTCKETSADAYLKPDLSWIEKFNMSSVLKDKIREIYRNRHQGKQFYAGLKVSPFFNENSYSDFPHLYTGMRLLALYRYWNIIQYFFPSKHLTDKNWNNVLKEYIPKFVLAETKLEYQLAVLQLIGEINDSHAFLQGADKIDSLKGSRQAPFRVRFIENKLVVTDYYLPELKDTAGLSTGDIITHVNGKKIEYLVDSLNIYYPASNEATKMRDLANDLVRSRDRTMHIDYISGSQKKQKELRLYNRQKLKNSKKDKGICYRFLDTGNMLEVKGSIGYITLESIKEEDITHIKKSFRDTEGIIIDIRNYPSMYVPMLLGSFFISKDTPFQRGSRVNINNPGEFILGESSLIPTSKDYYDGKLVVLANEITQSNAENAVMAFRAGDNTTIIGSPTAGANGNISEIVLPGGLKTWFSGIGIYYPDGRETQRVGIVPDIEVKPTIQGIREGRDELLEKAIEIIKKEAK